MPIISLLLTLFILAILYARFIEPKMLIVRKVRINGNLKSDGKQPLRIALLSDFHYPRCSDFRFVRQAIEKSNQFDPHLVLILGDFFDKNKADSAVLPGDIETVFGGIKSRLGVFGVLGNHDHWFDAPSIRDVLQKKTSIQLIDNASVCVELPERQIYIAGVGDLRTNNVDYDQAINHIPPDARIVLLSHNPDVVEQIRDARILVQFSGHTHGGQVRLPFIGALRVPSKFGNRYSQGLSNRGNHLLYVNSGICSMKNIRFLCPPEVTWVEIF